MRTEEWKREHLGSFSDERVAYRRAISLWCWYYVTTEDFDRTVCPFRRDGIAVPGTIFERTLCNRYAALQMKILQRAAERQRIDRETIESARRVASELGYERQKGWLTMHGGTPSWSIDYVR